MKGFLHDPQGDQSMIRLALLISLVLGAIVILCGLIGWFMKLQEDVSVMESGAATLGACSPVSRLTSIKIYMYEKGYVKLPFSAFRLSCRSRGRLAVVRAS